MMDTDRLRRRVRRSRRRAADRWQRWRREADHRTRGVRRKAANRTSGVRRAAADRWQRVGGSTRWTGNTWLDRVLRADTLVRVEWAAVALAAVAGYFLNGHAPLAFLILVLMPDLSLIGYLIDEVWGIRLYNLAHVAVWPAALAVLGWYLGVQLAIAAALAWTAHLGVDRAVGLGLKYRGQDFRDTHLQRL